MQLNKKKTLASLVGLVLAGAAPWRARNRKGPRVA